MLMQFSMFWEKEWPCPWVELLKDFHSFEISRRRGNAADFFFVRKTKNMPDMCEN